MPPPSLLQRLKERKLVQWALAYLAGAFVVFQLLDALAEPLGLSTTLQRAILVIVAVGFFTTLVLAWYHGEKGRQRVSGPELLMVAALMVVAGVALSMLGHDSEEAPDPEATISPERDSQPFVAVLPLDNLSGREEDAWFTEGMHGQILTQLSKIASLGVISSTSVQEYRESPKNLRTIGEELGARYVAEGNVLRAGGNVRINIQLIDAAEDRHVWAETFDRPLSVDNLFSIQSEIAQETARAVGASVTRDEEARIEAIPTESLGAYEAYLLGQYHYERRDDLAGATAEALRFLRLAIQQDPDLAVAHATLAGTYALMASSGLYDPRDMWPQVERWARSAVAIDSTSATAVLMLAYAELHQTWDWGEAERGIRRAIQLSPSDAYGHQMYSRWLVAQGRIVEGTEEGRIAASLDPLSSHTLSSQVRRAFHSRRYEEAHRLAEVLLGRDPDNVGARWHLGLCFLFGGHPEQFSRLFPEGLSDRAIRAPGGQARLALIRGLVGEADAAKAELELAVSDSGDQYLYPGWIWAAYAALGEKDEAFAWIERGIEAQAAQIVDLGVSPLADPLRDDPRYQILLDRIGLGHLKARFDSLAAPDPRGET